jgi:phospholipid/cholesterol/gamma-HCH transport system ATP-binding protein
MAFLRRRDGGDGEGQQPPEGAQPPAEPPPAEPPPAEQPPAEQPTEVQQPASDQAPWEDAPTAEQPPPQAQAPAVTSEAPPQSETDRQAAADQTHRDARPQTDEDIPDNIWDQTRQGEEPYKWHSGTKRPHGSTDAVEFIDVKKSFGRNTILNGLNLGIPDDQISMILGPSGTGKSVCIKHMVGLLYPDEGDVLVHGESVPNMQDDELFEMRKKFGVLFQDGALFGSMNLFDNVAFPLRQHTDKGEEEIHEICSRRLREVGLSGAGDKMPNELSGGMRKRAGFARALVLEPDIVLFDEPDSGLDPVRTALLCELIKEIHAENGGCYVVITHDIMSARRVADYIAVLWKGRIVESGPASELFNSPNQFVRQFLSGEAQGPLGME